MNHDAEILEYLKAIQLDCRAAVDQDKLICSSIDIEGMQYALFRSYDKGTVLICQTETSDVIFMDGYWLTQSDDEVIKVRGYIVWLHTTQITSELDAKLNHLRNQGMIPETVHIPKGE